MANLRNKESFFEYYKVIKYGRGIMINLITPYLFTSLYSKNDSLLLMFVSFSALINLTILRQHCTFKAHFDFPEMIFN